MWVHNTRLHVVQALYPECKWQTVHGRETMLDQSVSHPSRQRCQEDAGVVKCARLGQCLAPRKPGRLQGRRGREAGREEASEDETGRAEGERDGLRLALPITPPPAQQNAVLNSVLTIIMKHREDTPFKAQICTRRSEHGFWVGEGSLVGAFYGDLWVPLAL